MLGIAPSSATAMCTVTPRALSLLAPIRLVFYPSASLPPCPYLRFFTSVVGVERATPHFKSARPKKPTRRKPTRRKAISDGAGREGD